MKHILFIILALTFISYIFAEQPIKELSLQDAITLALEKNLDLQIEKYNPEVSDAQIAYQKGIFYPTFSSTIQSESSTRPANSDLQGATQISENIFNYNFAISYLSTYGTNASLTFQNSRNDTNSIFVTLNPTYYSSLNFNLTQPLLRNFGKDNVQYLYIQAKNNKLISNENYRQKIIDIILATQQAYWDTVYAYENYEVKKYSLELAKKLLKDTETQVEVGSLAPIEVLTAKADVATREEQLIAAENLILKAENVLKSLIDDNEDPQLLLYRIKPTTQPDHENPTFNYEELVETALKNRPEISITEVNIKVRQEDEKYYKNKLLPDLNLKFSLGLNGVGGERILYSGDFFNRQIIGKVPGGYSDTLEQLFGADYRNWALGFEFVYPIFGKQEKANYLKVQLEKDKAILQKKRIKQQIIIELENALLEIEYSFKRIEAAKVATELQYEKLKAEEKKLEVGLSTNFYVLKYQEDLSIAKSNELAAIIAYKKAIAQLEHAISSPLPQSKLKWEIKTTE